MEEKQEAEKTRKHEDKSKHKIMIMTQNTSNQKTQISSNKNNNFTLAIFWRKKLSKRFKGSEE